MYQEYIKANPNIINNPELIEEITYREMRAILCRIWSFSR